MKIAVMFSGGLDSRLVLKLMSEKSEVIALYFKLPFSKDNEKEIKEFCKKHNIKLKIFDYSKGKLLKEYIKMIKTPLHGRGAGINPCIDCRLFMLKKAKEYADKHGIDKIATGEVIGQRPMSQHKKGLDIVEKESGLNERLIRPLMDLGIQGRKRDKQIALAEKFNIDYPNPAGGCLLCESALKKRFTFLIKRGLREEEIKLANVGRHFIIDKCWIVLGRDENENNIIEKMKNGIIVMPEKIGPSAVILDKCSEKTIEKVKELIKAYSKHGDRKKFERYLI
jgi:tRNA-specific 2-thiouridylase